jgi:polysaccharide export outer membrane protein
LVAIPIALAVQTAAFQKPNADQSSAAELTAGSPSPRDSSHGANVPKGYRIGAGDVLQISVWREPEASVARVVVRPDGIISLPLVKELNVLGLSPSELETVLVEKLAQFIHSPDVTVVVMEVLSKKVYLLGAAKREGPLPLLAPMTIMQVLSEAGGLSDFAKRKKIYLLRTENGKQTRYPFNYDAVLKGEHMEQNILVLPDDTIVVPH